jgi:hypothetical protein
MLGYRLIPFFRLFEDGLGHDVRQDREDNDFKLKLLVPQKLLAREAYRHMLPEPACRYQVLVQAIEIRKKDYPCAQSNREPPWD